ncbi:MAG: hypothetical protein GX483_06370 [Actinomycetaceae bacterium]|nr:hypothetical protein [Actinomycetaceae bacterium]
MNTTIEHPTMTAIDRCDACGAQAYVRVEMAAGELYFCAHHARKHATKIAEVAINIVDETNLIPA